MVKTGIILTGGGGTAAFEVGVLKVLLNNIEPDFFIGTSMGAVNAAYILSKKDLKQGIFEIEKYWTGKVPFPLKLRIFSFILPNYHSSIYSSKKFKKIIKDLFGNIKFEDLSRPLYVGAINMDKKEMEYFNSGKLQRKLIASCSLTPFLEPYKMNGNYYSDGGIDISASIKKAKDLGAKNIIIINKSANIKDYKKNIKTMFKRNIDYIYEKFLENSIKNNPDLNIISIKPKENIDENFFKLKNSKKLIMLGEESAKQCLKGLCNI